MSQKVLQWFIYIFIFLAVLLILCAVVSVETLSYHVAVLTLSYQVCYCSGVDVAATLALCPKEEQCAVIWILWSEVVPGVEIHRRLSAQYGNSALLKQSVYEWVDRFQNSSISVTDAERPLWHSASTTEENIEWICATITNDRRATVDEVHIVYQ
jgi:hypothetical protein